MTAELRLRQWARRNYIPVNERDDNDWHPVVLEEMRLKDRELGLAPAVIVPAASKLRMPTVVTSTGIVPLEPSRHDAVRIDQAHAPVPAPRMRQVVRHEVTQQGETFIPYYM